MQQIFPVLLHIGSSEAVLGKDLDNCILFQTILSFLAFVELITTLVDNNRKHEHIKFYMQ